VWTSDVGRAVRMARAVRAGVMSVNSNQSVHIEAPFGGLKRSGLGRELGMEVFDHYTEIRTVYFCAE
jgi:betaine-aldehyde dehydrogenase